jgi:hypothetical protein
MYIRTQDGFADGDLANLKRLLQILDQDLSSIQDRIEKSLEPDAEGLFDRAEYLVGVGFSAIQQYLASTYAQFKLSKSEALQLSPSTSEGITFASALNAGANYWKHRDEWGLRAGVTRDTTLLNQPAQQTIKTIEVLTPWDDYTLSNLLASLTRSNALCLTNLVPLVILWRTSVDAMNRESS